MESSTGQPLLFYQLLGVKDAAHPVAAMVAEEQELRASRDTLAVTLRQTAKVKADLLEKYRAKQQEVSEVEAKLLRMLHAEPTDEVSELERDDADFGHCATDEELDDPHEPQQAVDSLSGGRVLIDKRAEKRLRDKLNRHTKNLADLRRKLIEEDKRERARRRKVRVKRGEAFGRRENSFSSSPQQHIAAADELFMEDWENILTRSSPDEAEHYLASVHERRLEHQLLLRAVKVRLEELMEREEVAVAKLAHALKLQYRKIALLYHPDRSTSDTSTEMFQLLSKAYAVVGDTQKRRVYNDMGNHTLYLCVHEQDKDELRMADIRDAKQAEKNRRHDVLRITSGAPPKLRCPTVKFSRSRIQVFWIPLTGAGYTYSVSMEADGAPEPSIIYEGTDSECSIAQKQLDEGDYQFRVRASNPLGSGEWSEPIFTCVLEGGGVVNPFGRAEKMKWQQAKQEAMREDKRKRRRRKEQKKKERRLQQQQRSKAEELLLEIKANHLHVMQMINREKPRDLVKLIDRLLGEEHDDKKERLQMVSNWTNGRGETALVVAAMKGVSAAIKVLLDKLGQYLNLDETDNQHGRTALMWATINEDEDTVHTLTTLNKRSGGSRMNVNWQDYEGYTALHWAAELGQANMVSWLLRQPDVDVDIETYDKAHTPLHMAASHGHLLIVQMLYSKTDKAKTVATDGGDQVLSPAFLALMNEHYDVAKWLVRAEEKRLGATDPQAVRQFKGSLVHLAAMLDNVDTLRALFDGPHGADANARDSEGNTPLHLAHQVGNVNGLAYLRDEAGCDPLARNHEGRTPAQMESGEDSEESESDGEDEDEDEIEENEDQGEPHEGGDESECEGNVSQGAKKAREDTEDEEVIGECHLESLPQEIIIRILGFAYGRDACAMRQTSSFFKQIAEDNILWRTLFLRTFPFCFDVPRARNNWRTAYANQIAMKNKCAVCSRVDQLRVCSGCRLVYYCSPEHQNLHWRVSHRQSCAGPFRLLSGVKRLIAEERSKERVHKALSIFGLVEISLQDESLQPQP